MSKQRSIWTSGAEVIRVDAPRILRGRGDRRGFEPLAPAERLASPDRSPGTWRVGAVEGPVWTGYPVDKLLVDLSNGGLGDAIRLVAVLRGVVRLKRARRPIVVCRPGVAHAWLSGALHPCPVLPISRAPSDPDAVLPPIHMIPTRGWESWPVAPLTSVVAHLLNLPLQAMAGPCLNVDPRQIEAVRGMLAQAGWMGEPVFAVQTDTHPIGPELTQALRREKVPRSLDAAIPEIVKRGRFVLRVGAEAADESVGLGYGVVDLGGCSLSQMAAALYLADLAVTGDSGPLHMAAAMGTPVAALFGPSDPDLHVCAAGSVPVTPPPEHCPKIHCGAGSLLGGPLEDDHRTRIPLSCPAEGGCLTRMSGSAIATAAEVVYARVGLEAS